MNSNKDINDLTAEIARLNDKLRVMRGILNEWNCSSGPVWEYWKLKDVGETKADYAFLLDDEDYEDPPMPLFNGEF